MRYFVMVIVVVATLAFAGGALIWRSTESSHRLHVIPEAQLPPSPPALPNVPLPPMPDPKVIAAQLEAQQAAALAQAQAEAQALARGVRGPQRNATVSRKQLTAPENREAEAKWEVAFKDAFDDAAAPRRVVQSGTGTVEYFEAKKALLLKSENGNEIFAGIRAALPGDLRVRFKALRPKTSKNVSIGLFFNVSGVPGEMDGYFAEWARGLAQIKREHEVLESVDAPTPETGDRWVNLELRRVGGTITMLMENREVLKFDDAAPPADAEHDQCTFYVWSDETLIRDVVIERNANDTIKPVAPGTPAKPKIVEPTADTSADF